MTQSTTVLCQLLNLVPKKLFENLATDYHVDKHASIFRNKAHLAVLIFAQLTGLTSLRDIVHATTARISYRHSGGLIAVKKSTLADANKRIDWHFYHDLFYTLLRLYRGAFSGHKFPLPGKLFTLDSTLINVCLTRFPWALFRTKAGAFKLHTLLDNDGIIPADIIMTNGKVHDIRVARMINIVRKATYLLDRAYVDSTWLYKLHSSGAFFVTRWKINVGFAWSKACETGAKTGVIGEWIGYLDGTSGVNFPEKLRVVKYIDPETKKLFWFMTNLMDVDAQTIADLYRHRWQIELFFKWIKQNLKIKSFLGTSENAVLSQIWVAMIAYLLIKVVHQRSNNRITTHQLLVFINTNALVRVALSKAW